MAFTSIPQTLITVGKAVTQRLLLYIKDNFDHFNTKISTLEASNVPNGSFEIDSDIDDRPDLWSVNFYSGGTGGLSPSEVIGTDGLNYTCTADHTAADAYKPVTGGSWGTYWSQKGSSGTAWTSGKKYKSQVGAHGSRCFWFQHPGGAGNGGGYIESDYIPTGLITQKIIVLGYRCSVAGIKVLCELRWYDQNKTYLSSTTAFNRSSDNVLNWGMVVIDGIPRPLGARFLKIRLTGGAPDVNQAGVVYFDSVELVDEPKTALAPMTETINQAQVSTTSSSFADLVSYSINIPAGVGHLYIEAEINSGAASGDYITQAYGRMRIGTRYSTEITAGGEGYKKGLMYFKVEDITGAQTLVFQARSYTGGVAAYFRSPSTLRRAYTTRAFLIDLVRNQTVERAFYRDSVMTSDSINMWWATDSYCSCPCTCTCTCTCQCPCTCTCTCTLPGC